MKLHSTSLAIGIAIGIAVGLIATLVLIPKEMPKGTVTTSFFLGGVVHDVTTDLLVINQSGNETISGENELIEIKLVQGSAFFSQGVAVKPSELQTKAVRGVEVCAFVHQFDNELRAGKIFLGTSCEPFELQDGK